MIVLIVLLLITFVFIVAIPVAMCIVKQQNAAKKAAELMLQKGEIDNYKIEKVLKVLGTARDSAGVHLYSRLLVLMEQSTK